MNADWAVYLDSSALVKLVVREPESKALSGHLDQRPPARAAALEDGTLRSLNAIHLAAAQALGDVLGEVITYDRCMAEVAHQLALPLRAPA